MTRYRHTQVGWVPIFIIGTFLVPFVTGASTLPDGAARAFMAAASVLLLLVGVFFTSITTIVTDGELVYFHGPGVWRSRAKVSDIVECQAVRNRWWYGFGIRYTPHGWLFNTWGLDAVEIRLTTGRTFRVGTDEPQALVRAIGRVR